MLCSYCNLNKPDAEHILKCQNINNIQHNKFGCTPSLNAIYKMVLQLQTENEKLKKKIKRLEQKTFKKKKSIGILEWLGIHGTDIMHYENAHDIIIPTEDHLIHLFQSGYIGGYGNIIEYFCTKNECYFVAWEQKKQIYCWKNEWSVFTEEDLSNMVSKIQRKIMNVYSKWSKTANKMNLNNYMGMILGGETGERKKKNKTIYLNLWKTIKKDFHKETEYQITF
jgi:hypothetical protein